ncbi:hypothetical protein [Roseovarius aestuarii]|uniref:Uncharacterized protein n=1 Tax=Roseovarius aestuarii TaxID=475083 RepID=A0A1X7BNX1_9RHOB|nr:hypothetical protein [Roseovarius aestuarii]SMC11327.1 hypothetical protein ROA7745_01139 [Roseovarius aestuarii]
MIVLLLLSLLLCIPGALGLLMLKSDNERMRRKAMLACFAVAALLFVGWLGLFAAAFAGFGFGGGAPAVLDIAIATFIFTLPLLIAAIFTGFAGYLLTKGEDEDDL